MPNGADYGFKLSFLVKFPKEPVDIARFHANLKISMRKFQENIEKCIAEWEDDKK